MDKSQQAREFYEAHKDKTGKDFRLEYIKLSKEDIYDFMDELMSDRIHEWKQELFLNQSIVKRLKSKIESLLPRPSIDGRVQVRLSEIMGMEERRKEINQSDLNDIDFLDLDNKPIQIDAKIISDFKFIGLNNIDFITSEFYKNGFSETSQK